MSRDEETQDGANGMKAAREGGFGRFTLISLVLNVFFAGAAGALGARYYFENEHRPVKTRADHNPAKRIEELAAQLSPEDAAILRAEYAPRAGAAESARETLRRNREEVRRAFQAEPFDEAGARAVMAAARAAHSTYVEALQDVVASAAARMSPAGRVRLGEAASRERRRSRKAD